MKNKGIIITDEIKNLGAPQVKIGDWFWVKEKDDKEPWFGCVVYIGSNYLSIESPRHHRGSYRYDRVHFDDFDNLTYEPEAEKHTQGQVIDFQKEAQECLAEIQRITASLGVDPTSNQIKGQSSDNALVAMSTTTDIGSYKKSLIKAKQDQLPALFDKMKKAYELMGYWLSAPTIPMMAQADGLNEHIARIDDRIFNVSLYAGLIEDVKLCKDGEPAVATEKLHVMQRRLWMDEESLLDYDIGGMEFGEIAKFDEWLCRPKNMNRILPFPRTIVAMQVRRTIRDRELYDGPLDAFVRFQMEMDDKSTFLYIRNGEKVYRLSCDGLDFGELIFPNKDVYDPSEELMFKYDYSKVSGFMPKREYDHLVEEKEKTKVLAEQWEKENPEEHSFNNPHRVRHDSLHHWQPFNSSSVYFDDAVAVQGREFKLHNRIAMLLQGLFDRSDALHPHPPVKLWTPDGFMSAISPVYDSQGLYQTETPPSFADYKKRCNASICNGSMVIGQRMTWMKKEAVKENKRRDDDYRSNYNGPALKTYKPYGNPGPKNITEIEQWKPRAKKGVFSWYRDRVGYQLYNNNEQIKCTITVPDGDLFNIDAYKPGDYKQFFQDPRTRSAYMVWAPLLLAAEEYHHDKNNK
jgi:hypothetical protein